MLQENLLNTKQKKNFSSKHHKNKTQNGRRYLLNAQKINIQTYKEFLRCENGITNVPYTYENILNLISNLRNAN